MHMFLSSRPAAELKYTMYSKFELIADKILSDDQRVGRWYFNNENI